MGYLEWDEAWTTGIPVIDGQHHRLLALARELFRSFLEGRQADEAERSLLHLSEYVDFHFQEEEALMLRSAWEGLEEHRAAHRDLQAQVRTLVASHLQETPGLAAEVMDFLRDWLTGHLSTYDRRMAEHLRGLPGAGAGSAPT
jgi:hemerythrin-like metal-binding protein